MQRRHECAIGPDAGDDHHLIVGLHRCDGLDPELRAERAQLRFEIVQERQGRQRGLPGHDRRRSERVRLLGAAANPTRGFEREQHRLARGAVLGERPSELGRGECVGRPARKEIEDLDDPRGGR